MTHVSSSQTSDRGVGATLTPWKLFRFTSHTVTGVILFPSVCLSCADHLQEKLLKAGRFVAI